MMRKKLIILGSVLLLTGGAMFGWILVEKEERQQEASLYNLKYGVDTDDYVKRYEEWLQTPLRERPELPPILEDNGKAMTREQLRQEQQERLKADLDKLVTGEIAVHPFADVLYGENWQNELSEYKKRNELNEYVLTSSIVCTTMGGSIYAWWLLLWTARFIIRCSSGLRRFTADSHGNRTKAKGDNPVIAGAIDLPQEQQEKKTHENQNRLKKHLDVLVNSDRQCPAPVKSGAKAAERVASKEMFSNSTEKINRLLSDEKTKTATIKTTTKWGKQRSETEEQSKPLNSAITELTQQVSAIREYAACQQDRLEKLQDGYDWNIVRTFCLRVIRCIDNLESRISRLGEDDARAIHLEEIRDELIFALESSGIEQFEPEINSEYRGQEKYAEAVKDKQQNDNPEQTGKIAKVIRPGYQYFINEENVKVVRPAQVKLFA
jgi:molecular chaperone GrpE (heat shock protein)